MFKLTRFIARTLSVKLSLKVLGALAILLMAALMIMFVFSRRAVKTEALQKATQTLEATVQQIDNILLSVEQAAGNTYLKVINQTDQPEKVKVCCQKLVEISPYIIDCKILKDSDPDVVDVDVATWSDPQTDTATKEAITAFYLPIFKDGERVAVMAVDVSLTQLSNIVLQTKPSPNSYSTLLGKNGFYIVHPNHDKLNRNVFELAKANTSVEAAAEAMVSGETGYKHVNLDGEDCYVFYKPFERLNVPGRIISDLGWSAGIVYPEDDIFGDYNRLLHIVLLITAIGLLLLLLCCQTFIHRQLTPLLLLSDSAQKIADGFYDQPIPDSRQIDEVGRLQKHFQQMQRSLAAHVGEMKQLSETLHERGEVLQAAYEQAEAADRIKMNFLYNMSNQIISPVSRILKSVKALSEHYSELTEKKTDELVEEIQHRGENITELLNQMIIESEKK